MSPRRKPKQPVAAEPLPAGSLRSKTWKRFLRGPDPELVDRLYVPALGEAVRYDRCCAYFSSSVLAAAARGFGRLIERLMAMGAEAPKPAVRLVVNEELPAADVRALIETGDLSTLEEMLLKHLKKPKDLLEKRRLAMLGWLVKEGLLDVRVGVMRLGQGVVHAKFGIATDEAGDAVVFSGSGNESASGLMSNYERLEVSTSWEDEDRHREYTDEFEALWRDEHPDVHTVTLPEAVRLQLIRFAPDEPPVEEPQDAVSRQKAAMLWRFIVEAPYLHNGAAACDATAMVELWPHQRRVVDEVAEAWPDGRLLCDEVGLGKTIEAIFIIRRLMAGRGVRRMLFLLPKNLLEQWQGELREKGGLVVPRLEGTQALVWPDGTTKKAGSLADALRQDVLLVSREYARLEANLAVFLDAEPWDMVLLDEAHAARRRSQEEREFNSATLLLNLLRQLQLRRKARGLLLLSATPMQTHPWEPWDLLATLGAGGEWLSEFSVVRDYYQAVSSFCEGLCDIETADRVARLVASDDGFPAVPREGVLKSDAQVVSNLLAFASGEDRDGLARWLRSGSPLAQRMHRSTRHTLREYHRLGLLDQSPPTRNVQDAVFDYSDTAERNVYDAVTHYIDTRFEALERETPGKGFVMTVYRRRASSSPLSLQRSLERRRQGLLRVARSFTYDVELPGADAPEALDPDELPEGDSSATVSSGYPTDAEAARGELYEVEQLLERVQELGARDSKRDKFFDILRFVTDDGRPALVFTGYWDTLDYLREALVPLYGSALGCYSGAGGQVWDGEQWRGVTKDAITKALADGQLQVVICTDAASEGLNLQAAGALINYDLPWNPSRIEQRIGRIDRIGQRYEVVHVVNLFLKDSVDDRVYTVLRQRCGLFEQFVGPMQPVLARARRMLTGQEPLDLGGLESAAGDVASDPLPQETYLSAEAAEPALAPAPLNMDGLQGALRGLDKETGVRVRCPKGSGLLEVTGLGRRKVQYAARVDQLEANAQALPLSPHDSGLQKLAQKLGRSGERLPLVLGSFQRGAFRASVAYWVDDTACVEVDSLSALNAKIAAWDEHCPGPETWQAALRKARGEARTRVLRLSDRAEQREEAALQCQVEAARLRLRRELGRYAMCLGDTTDDLNDRLFRQMSRDIASSARLQKCIERLGGYPEWREDERRELEQFATQLTNSERQARLLGSPIDAALADPRWAAAGVG